MFLKSLIEVETLAFMSIAGFVLTLARKKGGFVRYHSVLLCCLYGTIMVLPKLWANFKMGTHGFGRLFFDLVFFNSCNSCSRSFNLSANTRNKRP